MSGTVYWPSSPWLHRPDAPTIGLLSLPCELRDLIFDQLIHKPTNTITMLSNFGCYKNEISACPPAVCAVNRQLRAEVLPAFYERNTFTAQLDNDQDLETARAWLAGLGNDTVRHLKRLVFCGWLCSPVGHMVMRRWLLVCVDLKDGKINLSRKVAELTAGRRDIPDYDYQHEDVVQAVAELDAAYQSLVTARAGQSFDVESLRALMSAFNMLCAGH